MSGLELLFYVTPEELRRVQESTKELEKRVELFQKRMIPANGGSRNGEK